MKCKAIVQFMLPVALANIAFPEETIEITPSVVATMDCIGKSVNFLSEGTNINPPPTPNNPDKKPVAAPVKSKALRHLLLQMNLPVVGLISQNGGEVISGIPTLVALWASNNILNEIQISKHPKPITKGCSGVKLANHKPSGERIRPVTLIKAAALYLNILERYPK